MTAIDKVIQIAEGEVGYLEKKSNSNLYDKTANAGSANYTKYWAEIKPNYQGQPWCACFVTWVFVQAFGVEMATKLLKHYPYVYCPTLGSLFTKNANPKRGDIVIFYRNGEFTHTGIVTGVNGDYFTTVEGNTSGGSSIVANGGGVCKKGYYNSNLPGTKFCTPNYDLVSTEVKFTESTVDYIGTITATELNIRKKPSTSADIIGKHAKGDTVTICAVTDNGWYKVNYPNIGAGYISTEYVSATEPPDSTPDSWAKDAVDKAVSLGILYGDESGDLKLHKECTRQEVIIFLYRLYQKIK